MNSGKIIVIGGGLAGLTSAILLNRKGFEITVIEKKQYPFHRVCGEYVSNEVLPFLKSLDIDIEEYGPAKINKLGVSSVSGKKFCANLDLGGFGISRYLFDHIFYKKALAEGVQFITGQKAMDVQTNGNRFTVSLSNGVELTADLVIGSYGKRSNLDQKIRPEVFYKRSPYFAVKYHVKTDLPIDLIQLHNFEGGYCGISKIEDDKFCICYLAENSQLKPQGSIDEFEKNVLYKNPFLKHTLANSDYLFDKPEVISEVSFSSKSLANDHIIYCGDSAGMITPLCGNGMAIAIHSAKLLSDIIATIGFRNGDYRQLIEQEWQRTWKKNFGVRLKTGRAVQSLFGSSAVSNIAISTLNVIPQLGNYLIKKTHGKPFNL